MPDFQTFISEPVGAAGHTFEDEGVTVPGGPHTVADFVGAGVSVSNSGGGKATITIPGGVGGGTLCFVRDIVNQTILTRTTCFMHKPKITGKLTIEGDGTALVF